MGIDRKDLANGVISYTHLCNIENGKYETSNDTLIAIAKKLKVPNEYLINHKESNIALLNKLHILKKNLDQIDIKNAEIIITEIRENYPTINSILLETYYYLLESHYYFVIKNYKKAINIFEKEVLPLLDEKNIDDLNIELKEIYYYINGTICYFRGDYKLSYQYFIKQLPLIHDNFMEARVNFNISLCLFNINDIVQAINYAKVAQNYYISNRIWSKIAETDNLLGVLYLRLNEFNESIRHLNNALELSEKFGIYKLEPIILHNFGLIEQRKGNLDKALSYLNKSLNIKKKENIDVLITYISILEIHLVNNSLEIATEELNEAKKYCKNNIDNYHLKVLEAKINLKKGEYDIYEKYMKDSINYYYNNKKWKYLQETTEEFALYYQLQKKYSYSSLYYKLNSEAVKNFYEPIKFT